MTAKEVLKACMLEARELCNELGFVQEDSVRAIGQVLFNERVRAARPEKPKEQAPAPSKPTTPPICPQCNSAMKIRNSAKGQFWGCTRDPDCKGIVNI